jgi:hypothetical protein
VIVQSGKDVLWIHYSRPRSVWYQLTEDVRREADQRWQAVRRASEREYGRCDGRYHCRGLSDFEEVEVWHFKSLEFVERHWTALERAGYSDLVVAHNLIGT